MSEPPLLQVRSLRVDYPVEGRGLLRRRGQSFRAVDGINLEIAPGETVALVGESGSGKSTAALAIMRLIESAEGEILFGGDDLTKLKRRQLRRIRPDLQMIFQDPYSSLDPSMVVGDSVGEPLDIHECLSLVDRNSRVLEALELVGLSARHFQYYAHELSGGQRQRVAIARAIVLRPRLILCDEPVSSLDVSTQSQIMNLLTDIQLQLGVSYLLIAHDLPLVRRVSRRVAVMYLGELIETGPSERVYERPAHPYTVALLSAIPYANSRRRNDRQQIVLRAEPPSLIDLPTGCRFHTRCPFAMEVCREVPPLTTPVEGGGEVACHLHSTGHISSGGSALEALENPPDGSEWQKR